MSGGSAMSFFKAVEARQSIRAYQDRPVPDAALQAILSAANQAPSAGNCQAYQILVAREPGLKRELARAAFGQDFVAQAPLVLVFCAAPARAAKYGERGAKLYCLQDAAVAVGYAQLAATSQGLGTCWVGAFNEDSVARALKLEPGLRPVAMLPVGYAAETPPRTARRPLADLVRDLPTLL